MPAEVRHLPPQIVQVDPCLVVHGRQSMPGPPPAQAYLSLDNPAGFA
jgi:hypothetical protein